MDTKPSKMGLVDLSRLIGKQSADNGWHDRFNQLGEHGDPAGMLDHVMAQLHLVGSEVAEAGEELRNGHEFDEIYYKEVSTGQKPEGFPVELADAIIRLLDLAYLTGVDIERAVDEKLAFNYTRGNMHGGKLI